MTKNPGAGHATPSELVTEAIDAAASGRDLSAAQAEAVLAEIMTGAVGEVQTAAFLIALRTKGETVEELVGMARTMRGLAAPVEVTGELLDTCGTGGGGVSTFNVSTTAAFVAAGAGARVAKHGNRSATSLSGSADLLEALGADIDLDPAAIARCIEEAGFGFMFAPAHHPAMRHVVPVRQALAVRTTFNFLGPLTNPAGAQRQLIGVSDPSKLELIAGALAQLGCERALVVSSEDGLDEISASGATTVLDVGPGGISATTVRPADFELEPVPLETLAGGTPEANAETTRRVLAGEQGPARAFVVVNAGAALVAAGLADSFADGARLAEQSIDSGAAEAALERFVAVSRGVTEGRPA